MKSGDQPVGGSSSLKIPSRRASTCWRDAHLAWMACRRGYSTQRTALTVSQSGEHAKWVANRGLTGIRDVCGIRYRPNHVPTDQEPLTVGA